MYVHVYVETSDHPEGIVPQMPPTLLFIYLFFIQDLSLVWNSPIRVAYQATKPKGSSCLSLLVVEITSKSHHAWLLCGL